MSIEALTVLMIRSKRAGEVGEGVLVAGGVVVVRAEAQAVFLLLQRLREDRDLGAHGVGDLDGHVAQPAESDDGDLLAGAGAPVAQRRVGGDAGAEQRCGDVELDALGDPHHEVLGHHHVGGVAALGDGAVAVHGAVGARVALEAVLLLALLAVDALAAGVDHAADADAVADGVLGDGRADLGDDAGDFVARRQRVLLRAPVAADGVDVRVADAGELDVDQDVVRANVPALDGGGNEGFRRGGGGVSVNGKHGSPACGWFGGRPGVRHGSGAAFRPGRLRGHYPSNTTELSGREALL